LPNPIDQVRCTIDPQHLLDLLVKHPDLAARLPEFRPSCATLPKDAEAFAIATDAEIRALRRCDEERIQTYTKAMQPWSERFRTLGLDDLPLAEAHQRCCTAALSVLPTNVSWP